MPFFRSLSLSNFTIMNKVMTNLRVERTTQNLLFTPIKITNINETDLALSFLNATDKRKMVLNAQVRNYIVPSTVNFKATDYFDTINWDTEPIYAPPVLQRFSDTDLGNVTTDDLPNSPSNTQCVESMVQLMATVAKHVQPEARDGTVRVTIERRETMKRFDTKKITIALQLSIVQLKRIKTCFD